MRFCRAAGPQAPAWASKCLTMASKSAGVAPASLADKIAAATCSTPRLFISSATAEKELWVGSISVGGGGGLGLGIGIECFPLFVPQFVTFSFPWGNDSLTIRSPIRSVIHSAIRSRRGMNGFDWSV